jgi:complement component 1 Q subcomponent-binding protein, mitochondrial
VRVIFSIADIASEQEGPEFDEEGMEDSEQENTSFPIRVSLSVTKSNAEGSVNIDTLCQEGGFVIENISFYKNAKLGTSLTAEADWTRRGLYIGPQFDTLDISLQAEFEKYLAERGIGESLALFIPEYAEHKEQKASIAIRVFPPIIFCSDLCFHRSTSTGWRTSKALLKHKYRYFIYTHIEPTPLILHYIPQT